MIFKVWDLTWTFLLPIILAGLFWSQQLFKLSRKFFGVGNWRLCLQDHMYMYSGIFGHILLCPLSLCFMHCTCALAKKTSNLTSFGLKLGSLACLEHSSNGWGAWKWHFSSRDSIASVECNARDVGVPQPTTPPSISNWWSTNRENCWWIILWLRTVRRSWDMATRHWGKTSCGLSD